jgi:hypothetical protein
MGTDPVPETLGFNILKKYWPTDQDQKLNNLNYESTVVNSGITALTHFTQLFWS